MIFFFNQAKDFGHPQGIERCKVIKQERKHKHSTNQIPVKIEFSIRFLKKHVIFPVIFCFSLILNFGTNKLKKKHFPGVFHFFDLKFHKKPGNKKKHFPRVFCFLVLKSKSIFPGFYVLNLCDFNSLIFVSSFQRKINAKFVFFYGFMLHTFFNSFKPQKNNKSWNPWKFLCTKTNHPRVYVFDFTKFLFQWI